MENKIDIERVSKDDPVKQINRRKTLYLFLVLCCIAIGALGTTFLLQWKELRSYNRRLIDYNLTKVEDLVDVSVKNHENGLFNNHWQSTSLGKSGDTEAEIPKKFMENSIKGQNFNKTTNVRHQQENKNGTEEEDERKSNSLPARSEEIHQDVTTVRPFSNVFIQNVEEEPESKQIFVWRWNIPSSAWLQLTPFLFNYGWNDSSSDALAESTTMRLYQ